MDSFIKNSTLDTLVRMPNFIGKEAFQIIFDTDSNNVILLRTLDIELDLVKKTLVIKIVECEDYSTIAFIKENFLNNKTLKRAKLISYNSKGESFELFDLKVKGLKLKLDASESGPMTWYLKCKIVDCT